MVSLVGTRREALAQAEPEMFAPSGDAPQLTEAFFSALIDQQTAITLVCETGGDVSGLAIACVQTPPPVYAPAEPVYLLDDLAISADASWDKEGEALIHAVEDAARSHGASSVLAVCPFCDEGALLALAASGHRPVSQWSRKDL